MENEGARTERRMKRRIAATAATAALALSGTAGAAPGRARPPQPTRPQADPVAMLAHADQASAAWSLETTRRSEMAGHRRRLAGALAAELDRGDAAALEHAIAAAEAAVGDAYARGERPRFSGGIPAALTDASGVSEEELGAAFESMSRRARERTRSGRS